VIGAPKMGWSLGGKYKFINLAFLHKIDPSKKKKRILTTFCFMPFFKYEAQGHPKDAAQRGLN
jgi:hypothetical protein